MYEIAVNVDEAVVSQLVDMGFSRNACVKAVHFSNNSGVEVAMNWIMEHMNDSGWCCFLSLANQQYLASSVI